AERPPEGVHDGGRPAQRPQPPAPLAHHRARRHHRQPRGSRARRRALALDAAPGRVRDRRRRRDGSRRMNTPPSERLGTGTPRLSLNRWTFRTTPIQEFLEVAASQGIDAVGLWRQDVAEVGLDALRRRVDDAGLRVSTVCRGGFLTASAEADRAAALEDNRRAIDETAGLGAPTLVLVVGGVDKADKDIVGARARVTEAIAELAPYAAERGVTLSIEPLHPMFAADRAVVSTLDQALDIAESSGSPAAGVVVDTYHVWWDPYLERAIQRAAQADR